MISEIFLQEFITRIINSVQKIAKNTSIKAHVKNKDVFDSLNQHLRFINNWSSEVNFSDLKKSKSTKKVFVDLDLYIQPLRVRIEDDERIDKFELKNIFNFNQNKHIALLGQVGSGKTTSLKFLCQSVLFNDAGIFKSKVTYPILIKLNDYNSKSRENEYSKNILFNAIIEILNIKFETQKLDEKQIESFKEAVVIDFLNENNILLLIDGFDELVFLTRRQVVIKEFEKLTQRVEQSKIVLTSRTSDFRLSSENLAIYEICPLSDEQVSIFAEKWLEDLDDSTDFITKIKKSPFYDTTIRPLTIAHLCAIYERNKDIPEKPKTVYKKIVYLLLEDWNQQRNIHRKSKYSHFENDRKFEFLSTVAFNLTTLNKSNNFTKNDLQEIYNKIFQDFDLIKNEMVEVVNEIESHNGIILESGFQKYQFAHKSIQEYLTAEYIVKLATIPKSRNVLIRIPNEMAIAIAISSNPSDYFVEFINERLFPLKLTLQFIKPFLNRLLLEKIDFNYDFHVTVAVLKLYSAYIIETQQEKAQLLLFYDDNLINEFEKLVKDVFKRNDKDKIFFSYEESERVPTSDGQVLVVLNLKKDVKNKQLPKTIYCRDSFID